jgi:hypothetical protein
MFTATIQLITQSVEVLLSGHLDIDFGPGPLSVIIATVALKLGLFIYCSMIKGQSASVDALRQGTLSSNDHFIAFYSYISLFSFMSLVSLK